MLQYWKLRVLKSKHNHEVMKITAALELGNGIVHFELCCILAL